ncbi:hypothetical protein BU16DRAFT_563213 [Lophium mytilinum]|uniref:Uncharacterized protein n=1 Tax=Lophium mytilinum TaxID=390894 RepID=A0A6A6QTP9_9PEZI|nr:hypothetical protein BU16DRAFT_563213 [Lophium mytilinum]
MCYFNYVFHGNCGHQEFVLLDYCEKAPGFQQQRVLGSQRESRQERAQLTSGRSSSMPPGKTFSREAPSMARTDTDRSHVSSVTVTPTNRSSVSPLTDRVITAARRYSDVTSSIKTTPSMATACESEALPTEALQSTSLDRSTTPVESRLDTQQHYDSIVDRFSGLTVSIDFGDSTLSGFTTDILQNDGKVKEIVARFESGTGQSSGEIGDMVSEDDLGAREESPAHEGHGSDARVIQEAHPGTQHTDSQELQSSSSRKYDMEASLDELLWLGSPTGEPTSMLSQVPSFPMSPEDTPNPTSMSPLTQTACPSSPRKSVSRRPTESRGPHLETARRAAARGSKHSSPIEPSKTAKDRQKMIKGRRETVSRKENTAEASTPFAMEAVDLVEGDARSVEHPLSRPEPLSNKKLQSMSSKSALKDSSSGSPSRESPRRTNTIKITLSPTRSTVSSTAKEASPQPHSPLESVYGTARGSPVSHASTSSSDHSYSTAAEEMTQAEPFPKLTFANVELFEQSIVKSQASASQVSTIKLRKAARPKLSVVTSGSSTNETKTPKQIQPTSKAPQIIPSSPVSQIPLPATRPRRSTADSFSARSDIMEFINQRTTDRKASFGTEASTAPEIRIPLPESEVHSPDLGGQTKVNMKIGNIAVLERPTDTLSASPITRRTENMDTVHDEDEGVDAVTMLSAGTARTNSSGSMLFIGCDPPAELVSRPKATLAFPVLGEETVGEQSSSHKKSGKMSTVPERDGRDSPIEAGKNVPGEVRGRKALKRAASSTEASSKVPASPSPIPTIRRVSKLQSWSKELSSDASVPRPPSVGAVQQGSADAAQELAQVEPKSALGSLRATAPVFVPKFSNAGFANPGPPFDEPQDYSQHQSSFYLDPTEQDLAYSAYQPMPIAPQGPNPQSSYRSKKALKGPASYPAYPPTETAPKAPAYSPSRNRSPKKKQCKYKLKNKIDRSQNTEGTFKIGHSSHPSYGQATIDYPVQDQGPHQGMSSYSTYPQATSSQYPVPPQGFASLAAYAQATFDHLGGRIQDQGPSFGQGDSASVPFARQFDEVQAKDYPHGGAYRRERNDSSPGTISAHTIETLEEYVTRWRQNVADPETGYTGSPSAARGHDATGDYSTYGPRQRSPRPRKRQSDQGYVYYGRIAGQRVASAGMPLSSTAPFPNPVPPQYKSASVNSRTPAAGNPPKLVCGVFDVVQAVESLTTSCNKCAPDH